MSVFDKAVGNALSNNPFPIRWTDTCRFVFRGTATEWRGYLRHSVLANLNRPSQLMMWPVVREGWEENGFRGLASRQEAVDTFLRDDL